ncbi:protein kinase C and casein kinase substrate in neurons protein 2-like isoform X2 [Paramacrobiotus metropolitanus]|uniref:protein kinase C and casein kinase substrate in neurons protein 2-like isoform X2 n=1 Tax=Paramacrobiotus metropolitanus TaxID=2943436 RepID=UPI0024462942|nr:protein kinase C and casein kinase substrate in neurons protein 2-like isoform X2 [Paramacrobiotus metropolitanus]
MADDLDDGEPIEGLSFWEPGGYKRTTKRIADGYQLCNDLVEMVQERCEIEAKYAAYMKNWSKKWNAQIDKGPEYGSMVGAWKAVLTAADRDADEHLSVKENLINTVQAEVKRWQKDNFHKGMMSLHFKEKKDIDEEFKKAQKPWIKKLKIVEKYKAEYHNICQKEQSAIVRDKNSKGDPAISEDQRQKIADEVAKLSNLKMSAKASYEDALRDLNSYNPRYMEDMKQVYSKCQDMENRRLEFFRERLLSIHHIVDLSNDMQLKQIFVDYVMGVEAANAKNDLKWWDIQRGTDMPMNWPEFEEWSPRLAEISSKNRFGLKNGDSSTISGGTFRKKPEESMSTTSVSQTASTIGTARLNGDAAVQQRSMTASRESINRHSNSSFEANPFNEDWSESPDALDDRSKPGVKVRALYPYGGEEADELTFQEGDVFEKIEERDEQGWCKGRKDGRIGLFPADYVEAI